MFCMILNEDYRVKEVGESTTVWFKNTNQYVVMEKPAFDVFEQLQNNVTCKQVEVFCREEYGLSDLESNNFVNEVRDFISLQEETKYPESESDEAFVFDNDLVDYQFNKRYFINNKLLLVQYHDENLMQSLHPLFEHLENNEVSKEHTHNIRLFINKGLVHLHSDGIQIGKWKPEDDHLIKGKFFMEVLNKVHDFTEDDWMTVLHASAIGNGDSSLIFAGDSGNGKSTITSLLLSKGYSVLADDFVPIGVETGEVYQFPARISVKESAFEMLSKIFSEINSAKEHYYEKLDKTVRYLNPQSGDALSLRSRAKAIIFVKYQKESGCTVCKLSNDEAIKRIIAQAWVSPTLQNSE